jgi:tetratricopeptide (TPR) repeat protein
MGEVQRVNECYERALEIARERGDRRSEGIALHRMAGARAHMGEREQALEIYTQVLELAREVGSQVGEARVLWDMSLLHDQLGNRERAIVLAEQALAIDREIGSQHAEKAQQQLTWGRDPQQQATRAAGANDLDKSWIDVGTGFLV